jgi:hypothetical protein
MEAEEMTTEECCEMTNPTGTRTAVLPPILIWTFPFKQAITLFLKLPSLTMFMPIYYNYVDYNI